MAHDWQELSRLTAGKSMVIEKVRLKETGIAIEGSFELPPLARLTQEDQIFAAAFLQCHGSIKQMEQLFGVSYPTIKNRLNRISADLGVVAIESVDTKSDILDRLGRGEINVDEAIKLINEKET
jgi:hypothetical protein